MPISSIGKLRAAPEPKRPAAGSDRYPEVDTDAENIAELNEKIGPDLAKLEREIDNADIYPQHAEVCRDLLNVIRMACGVPLPAKRSPASEALPETILDLTRHS